MRNNNKQLLFQLSAFWKKSKKSMNAHICMHKIFYLNEVAEENPVLLSNFASFLF